MCYYLNSCCEKRNFAYISRTKIVTWSNLDTQRIWRKIIIMTYDTHFWSSKLSDNLISIEVDIDIYVWIDLNGHICTRQSVGKKKRSKVASWLIERSLYKWTRKKTRTSKRISANNPKVNTHLEKGHISNIDHYTHRDRSEWVSFAYFSHWFDVNLWTSENEFCILFLMSMYGRTTWSNG